jgi:hypothetical protein
MIMNTKTGSSGKRTRGIKRAETRSPEARKHGIGVESLKETTKRHLYFRAPTKERSFTLKHYKIEELLVQTISMKGWCMRSPASTQSQASGTMSLSRKESLKKGRLRRRAALQGSAIIVSAPLVLNQTFRQETTAFGRRRVPRLARMQHVPVIIGTLKAICQRPTGLGTATPIKVTGGGLSIKDVVQGR